MTGFQFRSLRLIGAGLPDAVVDFRNGLNVISGASNAGKSFIFGALDFVCGAAGPLEHIPEADGYTEIQAVIETSEGTSYELQRSCQGGSFTLKDEATPAVAAVILGERLNRADPHNISTFLLRLSGLDNRRVRKNAENELQDLSFRNVAHLVLVDEETIIKKASPLHGNDAILKTAESNVFKLLLSGSDDAALVATKKKAVVKAELQAQISLLEKLVGEYREDLATQTDDASDLVAQGERLEAALSRSAAKVQLDRGALERALAQRREVWSRNRADVNRRDQASGLLARFDLLDKHYASDLIRLEAVAEAGSMFPPLTADICPLCGSPRSSHWHPEQQLSSIDIERLRESCLSERRKIETLRAELGETVSQLSQEALALDERIKEDQAEAQRIAEQIQLVLEASLSEAEAAHQELLEKRFQVKQAISLLERIVDLEKRQESATEALNTTGPVRSVRADIPPTNVEAFRTAFQSLLAAWHFPTDGTIIFDLRSEDFIIGSRHRKEQGKGSRALTHAAFTLALMQACDAQGLPHPGFVALDSPLVTFRDRDSDVSGVADLAEAVKIQVKDAFYRDLVTRAGNRQIIVFENEEPEESLRDGMNFVHFTGEPNIGRSGFFPPRPVA